MYATWHDSSFDSSCDILNAGMRQIWDAQWSRAPPRGPGNFYFCILIVYLNIFEVQIIKKYLEI